MLGKNKSKRDAEIISQFQADATMRLMELEDSLRKSYIDLEIKLNEKYVALEKALNDKYEEADKQLFDGLEQFEKKMGDWAEEQNTKNDAHHDKNDAHRDKQDDWQKHSFKHMTTVEDYVSLQKDILAEVRDCLKVLSLDKMKGGKRVLNDSN